MKMLYATMPSGGGLDILAVEKGRVQENSTV